ncbi:MAG: EAL domain-containing protein [Hydrogenovibrio sp.]|uniref:putative bifunctional diguanylate cyclase/phosphodiesterase n=1 Tax=Hydrogenovibrio sp. TaxID=2065821 RepID=UPI0028703DF4|nr:EAL domain-containing protein [Hydrogenovibrio sp.]MDR9498978.1 EAL domain-containing protein [Hydrogenovibrio sp.]
MKRLLTHILNGSIFQGGLLLAAGLLIGLSWWADAREQQRLSQNWQAALNQAVSELKSDRRRLQPLLSATGDLSEPQRQTLAQALSQQPGVRVVFQDTLPAKAESQPFQLVWATPIQNRSQWGVITVDLPEWLKASFRHLPASNLTLTETHSGTNEPLVQSNALDSAWRTHRLTFSLNDHFRQLTPAQAHYALTLTSAARWPTGQLPWIALMTVLIIVLYVWLLGRYRRHSDQHKEWGLNQRRFSQYVKNAHEAIILCDPNGLIRHWNPAAETLFGYRKTEVLGKPLQSFLTDGDSRPHNMFRLLAQENEKHYEIAFIRKNFETVRCEVTATRFDQGDEYEYALFIDDITQHKRREAEIEQLAYYDPLTGLENRHFFSQNVDSYLAQSPLDPSVVFLIDLDGFKQINDTLGHEFGDELLKVIGSRLNHSIRSAFPPPRLCRFGGDEFLVLLSSIEPDEAIATARRLLETLHKPIKIEKEEVHITASLGIAFYPEHGHNLSDLLRHADSAMYEAKAKGKNTLAIYDNTIEARLSERLKIERGLRRALDDNELELYYQPQIDVRSQQVNAVEALLRWEHPEIGPVSPDRFIAIAEQSSLILEVGHWVLQTAVNQLKVWQGTPFESLHIAINVSSHQLEDPAFLDQVHEMMAREKVPFEKLEIELTERSIMSNAQDNVDMLYQIRERGLTISVDDFGTGYSSLSYLKRFPLNILKVDKSFVDGLPDDEDDAAISRAIIKLAQSLNMKVIAEGVENQAQFDFLLQAGCDMVQGYHYCKPLPVHALEAWMHHYDPVHAVAEPLLTDPQTHEQPK